MNQVDVHREHTNITIAAQAAVLDDEFPGADRVPALLARRRLHALPGAGADLPPSYR